MKNYWRNRQNIKNYERHTKTEEEHYLVWNMGPLKEMFGKNWFEKVESINMKTYQR